MTDIIKELNKERRIRKEVELSVRAIEKGNSKYLEGYAALYNVRSVLIPGNGKRFYEIIETGAFRSVLENNPDVKLTRNHDINQLLARSGKTLELSEDTTGLHFRAFIGNSHLWSDTVESVERGDLNSASFYFGAMRKDIRWEMDKESKIMVRNVEKVSALLDVSVVVDAAYKETSLNVAQRQLEEIEQKEFQSIEADKMRIHLLNLKGN